MSYARPCKYCNIQVIWDDKLTGSNKFKELQTNEPHTQERCKMIQAGQLQVQPQVQEPKSTTTLSLEQLDARLKKVERIVLGTN